jgi:hypothetical protein
MLSTIMLVVSIWLNVATIAAFTLGAGLGAWSSTAPRPIAVPVRVLASRQAARRARACGAAGGARR